LLSEQARTNARLFFRLAMRVVRDEASAADAVQTAMAKACERVGNQQPVGNLRAWLCQVVYRESLLAVRKGKTDKRHVERVATVATSRPPADRAIDLREAMSSALDKLPETTRVVVSLRKLEGWSGNEVAELLGRSASEVSRHLHEGMNRLRELMADWDEVGER